MLAKTFISLVSKASKKCITETGDIEVTERETTESGVQIVYKHVVKFRKDGEADLQFYRWSPLVEQWENCGEEVSKISNLFSTLQECDKILEERLSEVIGMCEE